MEKQIKIIQTHHRYYKMSQQSVDETLFKSHDLVNQKSYFMYLSFVDSFKDYFKSGWRSFESLDDLLSFVEYVVIPATLFNWYDKTSTGFYLPISSYDSIYKALSDDDKKLCQLLSQMKSDLEACKVSYDDLINFFVSYNRLYNGSEKGMFVQVLKNPLEVYDF